MKAKSKVWLLLFALLAIRIDCYKQTNSYRNRRQHITQQQQNPLSYNNYNFNQIQSRQQLDLSSFHQYLLSNNITVGERSQYRESGDWGEWSKPSECSRKCGGGIKTQIRICLDNNCVGPSKRYYSCNIHDCDPNEIDFRERQCSEYDNQPFKGRLFNWVPYLQTSNPCELNCMPVGERFYYKHSEKVIDGTKCYDDGSDDVCVQGQCMPVGCDKLLGSPRKEDKCGVCGGDGSSCQIIQGIFDSNQLKTGYNDIFTIPAGARNIKIEEIVPTSNYLAIRSVKGNYYLNGNWKIEFGRALKFASTVFNYVRRPQNGAEYLTATGPINEPLVVVILYQEPNRGITYEFSIKKNETQSIYDQSTSNEIDRMDKYSSNNNYVQNAQYTNRRPTHQFRWWHGDFTPCSKHCSGGQQQRRVVCLKISSSSQLVNISTHELPSNSELVGDEYCDDRRKPAHIQNCNTHVCPPVWQVGHWSSCNCDNKTNTKIKIRSVFCKKGMLHPDTGIPLSDVWTIAGDDECDEVRGSNRKPPSIKECDESEEGSTTGVSKVDIEEQKTTNVNETTTLTEKKQIELDDLLNELVTVPPLRKCEVTYAYKFIYSNWTKCDSRCGEGNQKRNASCIEIDPTNGRIVNENRILSDIYCRHEKKLETERKCNEIPCVGVDWVHSEWSKCIQEAESNQTNDQSNVDIKPDQNEYLKNKTKLSSIQTRTVKCSTASGIIYADELCGLSRKPETKRKCDKKQDAAQWLISEWSSCSAIECGNGVRTRSVTCAVVDSEQKSIKVVDEAHCNENSKPKCEEECTGKQEICDELVLLGPWTGCADRCEETRSVICLTKNQTEPIDCEDKFNHLILNRKCENEDTKDSVDPQTTECKQDDLDKNCTSTDFGCCPGPDGIAAEGSNFKGCAVKLDEECEKSPFGCCQHDKSVSFGPFQLGCTMNCNYTKYGCCHDKKTISLSPTLDDCLPVCASTEFGCCKDNSTATDSEKSNCPENAKKPLDKIEEDCIEEIAVLEGSGDVIEGSGDDQVNDAKPVKVCKKKATTLCKDSKFGCCDDEKTIKLDENGLGCDVNKDNLTVTSEQAQPIREIDNKTDDNSTSAIESCQLSEFGCCADGVTPSQGSDMQGCTSSGISNITKAINVENCHTSTYGCCPDTISYATGPDHLGCPCHSLQNGCCPDNQTPASGPKFEGCDCRTSPHGCCSDGRTVAFGPGNLGCPDGPALDLQFSAPACSLPKERGTCRNFTVKWFFDQQYGGCSRFWYGGCSGNGNRFSSQDECEEICMKPKGSDACSLPLVNGSCTQYKMYWGYNSQKHICEQFNYGGCLGNNNRFETREACEQTCYYSEISDPCEQQLQPGRCSDSLQRYFYNRLTNRCEPFVYTGCEGNKNNFLSELDCRNRCGARTAREICVLPVSTGNCLGKYPRYYFDFRSGACKEFEYSGCSGNNNRFIDKESCEKLCNSTISYYPPYRNEIENDNRIIPSIPRIPSLEEDKKKSDVSATLSTLQYICNNNKDPGSCDGSELKWYFNAIERKCDQFYYSGCGGNNNRFNEKYECEGRCIHQLSQYIRMQQELILRQQQKIIEEQNQLRKEQLEKQVMLKQNICLQPRETGNCYNFVIRYYYDKDDKGCHKFYFSGCNGNQNNFATFEECTQRCGTPILTNNNAQTSRTQLVINEQSSQSFRTEDCFLQKERGPCDNDEPKWFYDSQDGVCKLFYCCGGNNNRFSNGRECQTKCWGSQNICILPKVVGPCNGNFSQWYYNEEIKDCSEFTYSGCQGNANRFSSKEMCLEACSSQSQNNYPKIHHEHPNGKKESDICHLKPEKGDGTDYLERNYYDPVQNTCKIFIYSGVGGNRNNFESRVECERQCVDSHKFESSEPTDLSKRQEICLRSPDKGDCHNRVARWYYDPMSFTCLSFVYSGCGGNLNKFLTFDNCYKFCGGVKTKVEDDLSYNNILPTTTQQPTLAPYSAQNYSPTPPPVPTLEERPPQVLPSDCPVENCNNQRCTFGIDHYTDSRGCPKCRCSHPCHIHPCPKNQRCAVEVYRTESGQPLVQPICRLINKPGQCPTPVVLSQITGSCESTCRIDADCRGTDKCCNNGCANVCAAIQVTDENIEDTSEESEKLTQKVKLNDQAILNCGHIPAKTEVSVAWIKDKRPVLQTTSALQNRIQILANGSLLIIQTRPEDNGEYTCSYAKRETSELVTKKRIIEVYDPVSIVPGTRQVIATLNQPSVLECNARGIPPPIVTWWKDKRMLPISSTKYQQNSENYQLRINSVSSSDAGLYICQAHNDYGPIKVYDVSLLLEFEPNLHTPELNDNTIYAPSRTRIQQQQSRLDGSSQDKLSQIYVRQGQIIQSPNNRFSMDGRPIPIAQEPLTVKTRLANEEYKTGSSLRIECITNQPANITWYYNNEPIEASIQLNNLARRDLRYAVVKNPDNSISIDQLIRQHSGSYKCKASNDFSYALSDMSIEVEDVPLPSKCRDSPNYLNCQTIVAFRYCSNKTYFQYCCKSCVLSKQVSIEEVRSRLT